MKILWLMCGSSFSGKSTLARAVVEKRGCSPVSLDEINRERGVGFGGDSIPVEEWERTHQVAIGRLEKLMLAGRDIVLDDTNCFRWLRDRYRSVAAKHGYRTVIIYMDIPIEVLRERMIANESTQERRGIKEAVFMELFHKFEHPQPDEPTLTFTQRDHVTEWISSRLVSE